MPGFNPDHHLWRNGRLWWIAFTVVYDGWRQERVRRSLGTADVEEARRRRDALLLDYASRPAAEVIALREARTVTRQPQHAARAASAAVSAGAVM
jgi:hypothetical protein